MNIRFLVVWITMREWETGSIEVESEHETIESAIAEAESLKRSEPWDGTRTPDIMVEWDRE